MVNILLEKIHETFVFKSSCNATSWQQRANGGQLIGGELQSYNEMMNEARALATKRMVEVAKKLKADGIVNIRYASSSVMQNAAEVIAYGTAVRFKK